MVYDDKRLDRIDARRRRRSDEDRAQILRIVIRVIDAGSGPVPEEVMRREVAVDDVRVPAVMIPAWMEVLRRQERQAHQAEHGEAGDCAPRQAVGHHNKIMTPSSSRSRAAG
jgi:predicted metal-dependent peptidase